VLSETPFGNHCYFNQLMNMEGFDVCSHLNIVRNVETFPKMLLQFTCRFYPSAKLYRFFIVFRYNAPGRIFFLSDCFSSDNLVILKPLSVVLDCITIAASSFHFFVKAWVSNEVLGLMTTSDIWKYCIIQDENDAL
jgi:hypothetical protein